MTAASAASLFPQRVIQIIFYALDDPSQFARVSKNIHKCTKSASNKAHWILRRGDTFLRQWADARVISRSRTESDWIQRANLVAATAPAYTSSAASIAVSGQSPPVAVTKDWTPHQRLIERLLSGPTLVLLVGAFEAGHVRHALGGAEHLACGRALWSKLCELKLSTVLSALLLHTQLVLPDAATGTAVQQSPDSKRQVQVAQITTILDETSWREVTYAALSVTKGASTETNLLEVLLAGEDGTSQTSGVAGEEQSEFRIRQVVPDAPVLAAKLGSQTHLKRLVDSAGFKLEGLKFDLMRAAAGRGHLSVAQYLSDSFKDLAGGSELREFLGQLQILAGAAAEQNKSALHVVVGNTIREWREQQKTLLKRAKGSLTFQNKWRVALEMALEVNMIALVEELIAVRTTDEARDCFASAQVVAAITRHRNTSANELAFSVLDTSEMVADESVWRSDICKGLPAHFEAANFELLKRFCLIHTNDLANQLGYDLTVVPVLSKLANERRIEAARYFVTLPFVRKRVDSGELEETLWTAFHRGHANVITVLNQYGISISWMDKSASDNHDEGLEAAESVDFLPNLQNLSSREAADAIAFFAALGGTTAEPSSIPETPQLAASSGQMSSGKLTPHSTAAATMQAASMSGGTSIQLRRGSWASAISGSFLALPNSPHRVMVNTNDARWTAFLGSILTSSQQNQQHQQQQQQQAQAQAQPQKVAQVPPGSPVAMSWMEPQQPHTRKMAWVNGAPQSADGVRGSVNSLSPDQGTDIWQEMIETLLDEGEEQGLAFFLGLGGSVPEPSPRTVRKAAQSARESAQEY
ncbi:hypothetical protein DFJ73DRAFT_830830 [Zopfochytrium polystomum]|nr:hypothetical protein DFJ73DRAFT_830830 [Zopfochytrium polystomum]